MAKARTSLTLATDRGYNIYCLDGSIPGQKAMIICLHGFAGSKLSSCITKLDAAMAEEELGTFTFDWPAHGKSDSGFENLTIENCMKDLETVCEYVKTRYNVPLYCFATSFGGYLTMLYHHRHPEEFAKIILRSPALKMGEVIKSAMKEKDFNEMMAGDIHDFGHNQPLLLGKDFYEDVCAHDPFSMSPAHPENILVIHGECDSMVPPVNSRDYGNLYRIPVHFLKGADHDYANPGDLDWVMEQARDFFGRL